MSGGDGRFKLGFGTSENGEATRGFTSDESLQARVQESRLLLNAGELGSLLDQFVAENERRSHAYTYAFTGWRCRLDAEGTPRKTMAPCRKTT